MSPEDVFKRLREGKPVGEEELKDFFKGVATEAKNYGREKIEFETEDASYVLYAPIDPPWATVAEIDVTNNHTGNTELYMLLLSVNMEQVNAIFHLLRKKDERVIKALEWVLQQSIIQKDAAHILCWDFATGCPYAEVTRKEWLNEDQINDTDETDAEEIVPN